MDYKEALKAIKALDAENAAELVSAIEGHVQGLEAKNYEVIGEKRTVTQKAQSMQQALEAVGKAVGIEGELEQILEGVGGKVQGLTSELQQLRTDKTALETRATEAEGKVKAAVMQAQLADYAAKAGAVPLVLEKLLGDKLDEFKLTDDGKVLIGDKPIQEYVKADEGLAPFETALFPTAKKESKSGGGQQLSGNPPGGESKGDDPLAAFVTKNYAPPKAVATP